MIKKIVCIAVLLCCISSIGVSEDAAFDFSSMPTDKLIEIRNDISKELLLRMQIDSEVYYPGLYIVGEDLEPGAYIIQVESIQEFEIHLKIEIHASYESFVHYRETTEGYYLSRFYPKEVGESTYLRLKDKQLVEFDGRGTFRLIKLDK